MKNEPIFSLGQSVYAVDFGYIRDKLLLDFTKKEFSHKVTEDDLAIHGNIIRISIERNVPILYDIEVPKGAPVRNVPEYFVFSNKEAALKHANDMITNVFNDFFSKVSRTIYKAR